MSTTYTVYEAPVLRAPNSPHIVPCPTCGSTMRLIPYKHGVFYGCPNYLRAEGNEKCTDSIPAERDGTPYTLAKREAVKAARIRAHRVLDRLWLGGGVDNRREREQAHDTSNRRLMTRRETYKWLRKQMRLSREECHVSLFDVAQCDEVVAHCREFLEKAHRGAYKAHTIPQQQRHRER